VSYYVPFSAFFEWLLLILSEGIDRLVLFCISLTYKIALCSPLKISGHLFDPFLTICKYFNIVFVRFRSIIGKLTHFSFIKSVTSSFFEIRSSKDSPI
jgi:hypothetical protein